MFQIEFWKPRIHFKWTAPSTKTPPVTSYKFYRAIYPNTETELLEASDVPFTKMFTEYFLLSESYNVQVSAVNLVGEGPKSAIFLADLVAINKQLDDVCADADFFNMSEEALLQLLEDCMDF